MIHKANRTSAAPGAPWYRLADMCRLFDCAPRTIWKWVSEGRIPAPVRQGSRWTRWAKAVVDAHVAGLAGVH